MEERLDALSLAGIAEAVALLPRAVVVVDREGRPLWVNPRAREILEEANGLLVREGRLVASHRRESAILAELVEAAACRCGGGSSRLEGIVEIRRGDERLPLKVLVAPWRWLQVDAPEGSGATLFVSDPERRPGAPQSLLRRVYGLTRSQARLASLLMQGCGIGEAASKLHVTEATVRTHLRDLFAATGTRRQAELVQVLLSGPATLDLEVEEEKDR